LLELNRIRVIVSFYGVWGGGANIPRCLEAVRQLLAVIKEFLLFRFKGLKCLLFVVFLLLSVIVGQPACSGVRQRNFDFRDAGSKKNVREFT
jgi:hypothetical protein